MLSQKEYKEFIEYCKSYTELEFLLGKNWENNKKLEWVEDV